MTEIKWEYYFMQQGLYVDPDLLLPHFEGLGNKRWQFVESYQCSSTERVFIFKREKQNP